MPGNEKRRPVGGGAVEASASGVTPPGALAQAAPGASTPLSPAASEPAADVEEGCGSCQAVALAAVAAEEDPGSVLKPGDTDDEITGYRVSKKTGAGRFCSHGGYCYPRFMTVDGQQKEVLRLRNCAIGGKYSYNEDSDEDVDYKVGLDRLKDPAVAAKCHNAHKHAHS